MTHSPEQNRREDVKLFVHHLTSERAELLALYCRVAGVAPFYDDDAGDSIKTQELLQSLCQIMIDYLSMGHFSLYERIARGRERRQNLNQMAEELYPVIAKTTEVALHFNDKYDCEDHCELGNDFEQDLSSLGEALATRIELEDKILRVL